MRRLLVLCVAVIALVISTVSAPALHAQADARATGVDSTTAALIEQLLGLTRAAELIAMGIENAIPQQRMSHPDIPEVFWEEFVARARSDSSRFVEMLIPIYANHLSQDHLEQLIAFYESPVGQHFAATQPLIARESMAAGRHWGAQLGAEISADLAQRGIRIP